ncbi:hypothetical protein [Actinomadura logoneensis]|uniref:hypothetical protein n=1 Tax=Actinomadura logoneensis TaxID=2293572 RepID=UPI001314B192|nr:hypothetical protein [Actinomadura logoneensis]
MQSLDTGNAYAAALTETARLLREEALLQEAIADLAREDTEHPGTVPRPPLTEP